MSTLLDRQIKVNRIVTTSPEQARAIEDPSRAKIIEVLYHASMTADQIAGRLRKSGHKKALTTIRHHLEVLKESGLVEVVRIEESRGAITKYYGTSTRLLGYDAPEDFDSQYSAAIKNASKKLEDVLKSIAPKAARNGKKSDPQYSQYVMTEIINRALAQAMEGKQRRDRKPRGGAGAA